MTASSTGPSPHLRWSELACRDALRTPYPLDYRTDARVRDLALVFETLRQACGNRPLKVLSAYRTRAWNEIVGGAPSSQHLAGRALDLQTPGHLTPHDFWAIAREVARLVPTVGGLGRYDWGIHVDVRPRQADHAVVWDLREEKVVRG